MGKKRYAGLMYVKKNNNVVLEYMDAKGIELIRRDNCQLAKMCQQDVLNELLYNKNPEAACNHVQNHLSKIVRNEYDQKMYEMSKALRKGYKNEDLPHVHVVKKMNARDKGSAPQVGDRVPYVLVETTNLKAKTWEKAEDPVYALRYDIPIDRLYYVERQIVNPVTGLLKFVEEIPNPMSVFEKHLNELRRQRIKNKDITTFFAPIHTQKEKGCQAKRELVATMPTKTNKKTKQNAANNRNIKDMLS